MKRAFSLLGVLAALLLVAHVLAPQYGALAGVVLFLTYLSAWLGFRHSHGFQNVTAQQVRAAYAAALLVFSSIAAPSVEAKNSEDSKAAWYNPSTWGETTWRTIGTVGTLGAACGLAVVTLGAGIPACAGAAALTAGANVGWDVGVACLSGSCRKSEIGQATTNFADGNIHEGFNHLISLPAPAAGTTVEKLQDGQKIGFLDAFGVVADAVPVTKAGKVVDLAAKTARTAGTAAEVTAAGTRLAEAASGAVKVTADPARYASKSLKFAEKSAKAANAGRTAKALEFAGRAEKAAQESSAALRLMREADPTLLQRAVSAAPKIGKEAKAAQATRLGAAQKAVNRALKSSKIARETATAGEAARIAKVAAKDAKGAVKAAEGADALRAAEEAAAKAAKRLDRTASKVARRAGEVKKIAGEAKPLLKDARLPSFSKVVHTTKAVSSLDNGIVKPNCGDLACLPAPSADPNSPWMTLQDKREAFCLGDRGVAFEGWDARICEPRVTELLDCLQASQYENPFADPTCTAMAGEWVYDSVCTASDYEFCPEQTEIPQQEDDSNPGPWGTIDACSQILPRELCEWVLVEGGDPAKALLDVFYESMRPVISLSQGPEANGAQNGGRSYLVPVLVTHGGVGLSCSDGNAAELAHLVGYCYDDYVIHHITVDVDFSGEVVNSMDASRQDLADAQLLDPDTEEVAFKLPAILPRDSTGNLGVHVVVAYQLVRAYSDGRPPILEPNPSQGAAAFFTVEDQRQWSIDTGEGSGGSGNSGGSGGSVGGGGGGGPEPDPDPNPCSGLGCGEYIDDNFGGVGFTALLNWKLLLTVAAVVAVWIVYRNGMLYTWTKGNIGRAPKSPLDLYRKPGPWARFKQYFTGRSPARRLKPEFEANGVPVVVPPNADSTGPDPRALRDLLDGES